jgi:hypothetical protein
MTYGRVQVTAPAMVVLAVVLLALVGTVGYMLGWLP